MTDTREPTSSDSGMLDTVDILGADTCYSHHLVQSILYDMVPILRGQTLL
jgi:hypothetical protein